MYRRPFKSAVVHLRFKELGGSNLRIQTNTIRGFGDFKHFIIYNVDHRII